MAASRSCCWCRRRRLVGITSPLCAHGRLARLVRHRPDCKAHTSLPARREERRAKGNGERAAFASVVVGRLCLRVIDQSKPRNSLTPQEPSKTILLKEIETASLYTFFDNKTIKCIQRSATFLQPSQQDPIAFQLWQMSRGRPIDVRFYDVTYTRR